jgi:CRISPR/Cas system-associated endoribonuclease Cas2
MDLQTRKLEFIKDFLKLTSEEAVITLEKMLKKQKQSDFESDLAPMSLEELNSRIDKSIEDSQNDRLTHSTELKSEIDKWT